MNTTPRQASTLPDLQRELARTHRVRLMRRRAIATGAVALPALALVFTFAFSSGGTGSGGGTGFQPVSPTVATSLPPAPPPLPTEGEDVASSRQVRRSSPVTIESMTDEELLAALAEAGQPSGLVTINGKTTVVANRFPDGPSPFAPFASEISAPHQ